MSLLPAARACEYYTGLLRVTHPWTRATSPDDATAVLCMRFDEVTEADRLIGVETSVAGGVEMGGHEPGRPVDVAIAQDSQLELSEAGVHLRLTQLRHPLQVGREYPLTLMFERSGLVLARLSVDFTPMRFAQPPRFHPSPAIPGTRP
ncbi:MAG: copper chaperone PCu(A)C [Rubrivivax sp.]|nr:copper chaperone PCu(A)C [Rubrivivax sp.]